MKKFIKLQKLFKNKSLKVDHIEESRDCDALIASLLGFKNLVCDADDEWVGDSSIEFKSFDCLGRCVVPKFTSDDSFLLLHYIRNSKLAKDADFTFGFKSNSPIVMLVVTTKKASNAYESPTISVAIAKLFLALILK